MALKKRDIKASRKILVFDSEINKKRFEIENQLMILIATQQPMAHDLRAIIAMSKAVGELERVGDEAKKIARFVIGRTNRPGPATTRDARHLGRLAVSLLRLSLDAFDRIELTLAAEVIARDKELDAEYAAGLRRLMTRAMEDARNFDVTLEAAFVLKSLERIGDHARNLARQVQAMGNDSVASGDTAVQPAPQPSHS